MGFGLMIELPVEEGTQNGGEERSFQFDKPAVTFGRHGSNDVHLPYQAVSSKHAQIMREGDVYYLVDTGSTNGTWLNGERVVPQQRYPLEDADVILLSNIRILFVGDRALAEADEPEAGETPAEGAPETAVQAAGPAAAGAPVDDEMGKEVLLVIGLAGLVGLVGLIIVVSLFL